MSSCCVSVLTTAKVEDHCVVLNRMACWPGWLLLGNADTCVSGVLSVLSKNRFSDGVG